MISEPCPGRSGQKARITSLGMDYQRSDAIYRDLEPRLGAGACAWPFSFVMESGGTVTTYDNDHIIFTKITTYDGERELRTRACAGHYHK